MKEVLGSRQPRTTIVASQGEMGVTIDEIARIARTHSMTSSVIREETLRLQRGSNGAAPLPPTMKGVSKEGEIPQRHVTSQSTCLASPS